MSSHYLLGMAVRTSGGGGVRMSAEKRRALVLAAAVIEFARGGLAGTSTEAIAARAGISQPYLFRLFPTKKALFVAVIEETFRRTAAHFEAAVGDRTGLDALEAMKASYWDLFSDRTYLLTQMQAYASSDDPEVQAATRSSFSELWTTVERLSGLPFEVIREFFAHGMLINVAAAMNLPAVGEQWAQLLCLPEDHPLHHPAQPDSAQPDSP